MKRKTMFGVAVLYCLFAVMSLPALTLKIGSIAPAGSPWDQTLKEIAEDWEEISDGRLSIKIYAGGIAGDEEAMIRKMRVGQLDGVVLTSIGLDIISPDLFIMSLPRIIRSADEYDYLVPRMEPTFDKIVSEKGYKLVTWTMAGWIKFFSTKPVITPDDLKRLRLGIIPGQEGMERIWKNMGYRVLPVDTIDWLSSFQGGMIEATFTSPLAAAAYQVFGVANHMLEYPISPLLGALVFSDRSWKRIPESLRIRLLESAQEHIKPLYERSTQLEEEAMSIMKENGLVVHTLSDQQWELWEEEIAHAYSSGLDKDYSGDVLQEIQAYLEEYRKK